MRQLLDWLMLVLVVVLIGGVLYIVPDRKNKLFNEFYKDIKMGTKAKIVSGFYEGCEAQFVAWTKDDNQNVAYHVTVSCILEDFPRHVPIKLTPQEAKELKVKGLLE
ncbi:MAG: hypothetical protein EBU90_06550 [Proteobacteria bacterium]|nr:hypothetical protein [Pseudomonadota bacterium]